METANILTTTISLLTAAGQILIFDPSGKQIDTIEVPQRPTCLVFGGQDRKTLFITARSSLYSVHARFPGAATGR